MTPNPDPLITKYNRYAQKEAAMVTQSPVKFVVNKNAKTKNSDAHLLKYEHPTRYAVVMSGGFYNHNKNDPQKIDNVIGHEVAHIKYPYSHGADFSNLAKKLGVSHDYRKNR